MYPYAAHLKYMKQTNEPASHEKTMLLANYFHSSKEENQRLDGITNLVLLSNALLVTFGTELQDKH